ncbi:MAG: hypothetical protein GC160_28295 [Acidobacteria bacterium]|nr:hypothetical protein [Acidobacteriota bacterium]
MSIARNPFRRPLAALALAVGAAACLPGQSATGSSGPDFASVEQVSLGADAAGRRALCRELAAAKSIRRLLVHGPDLLLDCPDAAAKHLTIRSNPPPANALATLCEIARKPAGLVYTAIGPIALRSGAAPLAGVDLAERLEPLGVRSFGDLLFVFGFDSIALAGPDQAPAAEAPLHQWKGSCSG